jgi:hypothetical protein
MSKISLKNDVELLFLDPHIVLADVIIASIFAENGYDCQITSGTEGQHMAGSLHYIGKAHDFMTHHVSRITLPNLVKEVVDALPGYVVLLEDLDLPNEHMHVQFSPSTYG